MKQWFLLVVVTVGFAAMVVVASGSVQANTCPLTRQQAYRTAGDPAVYYITTDCTKRPFKKSAQYFTYFNSWHDTVQTSQLILDRVPDDTLGFMPWGPLYDPQYGALVKTVDDPKVYLLLGGEKYWITEADIFRALNYKWHWVEDVDPRLLDAYELGAEIDYMDHHPKHTLVTYENSPEVYQLEPHPYDLDKQVKRHIKDEQEFNKLGFRWDRIVTIDDSETYTDKADARPETEKESSEPETEEQTPAPETEKTGCTYANPSCSSDYTCVDNQCIQKDGCRYNNPSCGEDYQCTNNQCVRKDGCLYDNPSCGEGYACVENACEETWETKIEQLTLDGYSETRIDGQLVVETERSKIVLPDWEGALAYGKWGLQHNEACIDLIADVIGQQPYYSGKITQTYTISDNRGAYCCGTYPELSIINRLSAEYLQSWFTDDDMLWKRPDREWGVCRGGHEQLHRFMHGTPIGWANEGLATYIDDRSAEESGGLVNVISCNEDTFTTVGVDGPVDIPYRDLSTRDGWQEDPRIHAYYSSSCLWHYIKDRYGEEKFQAVIARLYDVADDFEATESYNTSKKYEGDAEFNTDVLVPVLGDGIWEFLDRVGFTRP